MIAALVVLPHTAPNIGLVGDQTDFSGANQVQEQSHRPEAERRAGLVGTASGGERIPKRSLSLTP